MEEEMIMTPARAKTRPSLRAKKDLILHTYDSLLFAQTRLFSLAHSSEASESYEISRKQELLLLDDLMLFALSARRLIELTRLKSFANRHKVPFAYLDQSEEPYLIRKLEQGHGFLTLVNKLIHATFVEYIREKSRLVAIFTPNRKPVSLEEAVRQTLYRSKEKRPIEQLLFVEADDEKPFLVGLADVVERSVVVAEKIVDVCSDDQIFLELDFRGVD